MYRTIQTKISCIAISLFATITTILALYGIVIDQSIGLHTNCVWYDRLLYPFAHANMLHLLVNLYIFNICFLKCNMSVRQMVASFLIALIAPASATNVVGLSGVCFALFGILFAHIKKDKRVTYLLQVAISLLIGCIVPHLAWTVHLFCFVIGLVVGLIFKKCLQQ